MKIHLHHGLGYVTVSLTYQRLSITLDNILLDTGSAGSIFSVDKMLEIGIQLEPHVLSDEFKELVGRNLFLSKT